MDKELDCGVEEVMVNSEDPVGHEPVEVFETRVSGPDLYFYFFIF